MAEIIAGLRDSYWAVMRACLQFGGRSRRELVWSFLVVVLVLTIAAFVLDPAIALIWGHFIGFRLVVRVIHALPNAALLVRRMHDIDRAGWWMFWPPVALKALVENWTSGANRFGGGP